MVLEPEKKKKQIESEEKRWARLDKRARARHELIRLVMGTIFLVIVLALLERFNIYDQIMKNMDNSILHCYTKSVPDSYYVH